MTPKDILAGLYSLGLTVEADGDSLRLTGPTEKLDTRRKALIQQVKPELLRLVGCAAEREAIAWADSDDPVAENALAEAESYFDANYLRCPHCGSFDIESGKRWRWCLTCEQRLGLSEHMLDNAEVVESGTLDAYFESLPKATGSRFSNTNSGRIGYDKKRASRRLSPKAGSNQQPLLQKD